MKYIILVSAILFCLFSSRDSFSQTDSSTSKFQFKIGSYYNSHLNYFGRTDSLRSSGFFLLAELWFKNRFYVNAAPVFTRNRNVNLTYAGTVVNAGMQSLNSSKSFLSNLFITVPVYKEEAAVIQSALKAQATANFSFINKIANVNFGGDIKYSTGADYGANAGIDHPFSFSIMKGVQMIINPSVYVYAGTQRFTENSYIKKNTFILFSERTEEVQQQINRFTILAYEGSIPLILVKGKWQLLANPTYVVPQNLVKSSAENNQNEDGRKLFYVVMGIKYSL